MSKLLSASILALGVMSVSGTASAVGGVPGAMLYIEDTSKPVTFTFGGFDNPGPGTSTTTKNILVYLEFYDSNGNGLYGEKLFKVTGAPNNMGYIAPANSDQQMSLVPGSQYTFYFDYNRAATYPDVASFTFKWRDIDESLPRYAVDSWTNTPVDGTDLLPQHTEFYDNGSALVGLENYGRGGWGWDDVVIGVTNVRATPYAVTPPTIPTIPAVPEPETWAMLLAGLSIVAGVARRRSA